MSAVINVVTPSSVILVADTRYNGILLGKIPVVLSDETSKIFQLSPSVAVGFTGNYQYAMQIKDFLVKQVQLNPRLSSDELAVLALSFTPQLPGTENVQFVITGQTSAGSMAAYTYQRRLGERLKEYSVNSLEPIKYQVLCDTGLMEEFEASLIQTVNTDAPDLPVRIAECCERHIAEIAKINHTVNDRPERIILSLHPQIPTPGR